MNRETVAFQEDLKSWVKLDTTIRDINSKGRTLRDQRNALENKITSFVDEHGMHDATIRINEEGSSGTLGFQEQRTIQPITAKLVRSCLEDLISDSESVDAIMEHIKESRTHKTTLNIKRTFE